MTKTECLLVNCCSISPSRCRSRVIIFTLDCPLPESESIGGKQRIHVLALVLNDYAARRSALQLRYCHMRGEVPMRGQLICRPERCTEHRHSRFRSVLSVTRSLGLQSVDTKERLHIGPVAI